MLKSGSKRFRSSLLDSLYVPLLRRTCVHYSSLLVLARYTALHISQNNVFLIYLSTTLKDTFELSPLLVCLAAFFHHWSQWHFASKRVAFAAAPCTVSLYRMTN